MNRNSIPLGRIIGIPIALDFSWFLIFVLMTWSFAASYYPAEFKNWSPAMYWAMGAITAILLFASVLLHELGHSVIALKYKIPVRRITLLVFGGVAEIEKEPPGALAEFLIAIAGPLVSFLLAVFFYFSTPLVSTVPPMFALVKYLAYINGILALFNLIPGFPLDGGRIFRAIVWGVTHNLRRATIIAANVGRIIAFGFIMVGVWQIFGGNFGNGLWVAFIGWFLDSAAQAQIHKLVMQELLADHKVSEVMGQNYVFIPGDYTLQELVENHFIGAGRRCMIVKDNDLITGLLTLHRLKSVARASWPTTTVAEVMIPVDEIKSVAPAMTVWDALGMMDRAGVNQLPVLESGRVVGMLSREDVITQLRALHALGV